MRGASWKILGGFWGLMLGLMVLAQAEGVLPDGWKLHLGNFYSVGVPPGFVATSQGEGGSLGRGDEVSLWNEKLQAQFCAYSPQWSGDPLFPVVGERREELTQSSTQIMGDSTVTELVITALDKSYLRFAIIRNNPKLNTTEAFGIRVPNMKVYKEIKPLYVEWKKWLVKYAD